MISGFPRDEALLPHDTLTDDEWALVDRFHQFARGFDKGAQGVFELEWKVVPTFKGTAAEVLVLIVMVTERISLCIDIWKRSGKRGADDGDARFMWSFEGLSDEWKRILEVLETECEMTREDVATLVDMRVAESVMAKVEAL